MVLKFVSNHLYFLGIVHWSNDANQRIVKFLHTHSSFVFISLAIFTVPTFCYCCLEANKFSEYVNSFFFTMCGMLGISLQSVMLYGKSQINQLIVDIAKIFNQRRKFSMNFQMMTVCHNLWTSTSFLTLT